MRYLKPGDLVCPKRYTEECVMIESQTEMCGKIFSVQEISGRMARVNCYWWPLYALMKVRLKCEMCRERYSTRKVMKVNLCNECSIVMQPIWILEKAILRSKKNIPNFR